MMRNVLIAVFVAISLTVTGVNIWAGSRMNITDSWVLFKQNPWAMATLCDAYAGFLVFWIWVAWRERRVVSKILWFVLVMGLGNIATPVYVALALARLGPGQPVSAILARQERRS